MNRRNFLELLIAAAGVIGIPLASTKLKQGDRVRIDTEKIRIARAGAPLLSANHLSWDTCAHGKHDKDCFCTKPYSDGTYKNPTPEELADQLCKYYSRLGEGEVIGGYNIDIHGTAKVSIPMLRVKFTGQEAVYYTDSRPFTKKYIPVVSMHPSFLIKA